MVVATPHGQATIQYFQRARFEYHPEFAGTRYEVELGLLGDVALSQAGWLPLPSGDIHAPAPGTTSEATPSTAVATTSSNTSSQDAGSTQPPPSFAVGQTVVVAIDALNVRASGSATAPVTGRVLKGQKLVVVTSTPWWIQVSSKGAVIGWVSTGYVTSA
jgi:hypothetical protein